MNDNDLITRREVELVLLEKGQKTKRYKLGEIWELNFDEIREALSEYQPKIVRCKDCKYHDEKDGKNFCDCGNRPDDWFCADGDRRRSGMTENRATEYLPRCFGVYSDISCGNCPYRRYEKEARGCIYALHEDALDLLKEQEPMKPTWSQGKAYCGNCGHGFPRKSADREINYCSYCGQAVKWNDD